MLQSKKANKGHIGKGMAKDHGGGEGEEKSGWSLGLVTAAGKRSSSEREASRGWCPGAVLCSVTAAGGEEEVGWGRWKKPGLWRQDAPAGF